MTMRRHMRSKSQGLATIELMIVTPVLFLMIAAIAELGWAFHHYKTLTRATRDGVRYAAGQALNSGLGIALVDSTVAQRTRNLVVYGNAVGAGERLLPNFSVADVSVAVVDTQHVRVTAIYQHTPIFAQLPLFDGTALALSFQMRSSTVMRAL